MVWRINDPQGNEAAKVKYDIVRWTRGVGLDLGCGPFKAWPHFIGVDNGHHWGTRGADIAIPDAANLSMFASNFMNFVFSSHLLEHMVDAKAALKEWFRVIKVGGHLVLYVPHKELYPKCGELGANPDHKHDFDNDDVIRLMEDIGDWELLVNEMRNTDNGPGQHGNEYSLYQVYRKKEEGHGHTFPCDEPRPAKTACVVRYGGMGDNFQTASVLRELKAQGYHITYCTSDVGFTVLKENPYIDEWYVQDRGQVGDAELFPFWENLSKHYDKFINLCESVEGTLLPIPTRVSYGWPESIRRKYMNRNYVEWNHELAEVPFNGADIHFYATEKEQKDAAGFIEAHLKDTFNIGYVLAGSSLHKIFPYQDEVIQTVLHKIPEARFVLFGSPQDVALQHGWEENEKVHCIAGKIPVRESLALVQQLHCVVGPETGLMNSVSMEESVHKVIYLSHSSHENLTRDWVNTTVVIPDTTMAPCYPCHKLHYGKGACPINKRTEAPVCASATDPEQVFNGIMKAYETWRHERTAEAGA